MKVLYFNTILRCFTWVSASRNFIYLIVLVTLFTSQNQITQCCTHCSRTQRRRESHWEAAALSGQAPAFFFDVSPHFGALKQTFFSGENKLGSPSKRLFKKPFLYASSKEPRSVNRHGEFTAQDIVGGTNGWSSTTTKAEGKEWRGVIHHTLNKASVTDCPWPKKQNKTKQRKKKNFFLIGEAVVFSFFFISNPLRLLFFFSSLQFLNAQSALALSSSSSSSSFPLCSSFFFSFFSVSRFPSLPLPPPCFFIKTIHCALLRPPSWNGKTNSAADRRNAGGWGQRKGQEERSGEVRRRKKTSGSFYGLWDFLTNRQTGGHRPRSA